MAAESSCGEGGISPSTTGGVYALVVAVERDFEVRVGSLGKLSFRKGLYVYVGSAQRNLSKRIQRHLRSSKRMRWHIDYMLASGCARVVDVRWKQAPKTSECEIAASLATCTEPVSGFGSSDCSCTSHLFRIFNRSALDSLRDLLDKQWHCQTAEAEQQVQRIRD